MRAKVKRAIKEAQVLSGARANFISLVNAGANETPFIELKRNSGATTMKTKPKGPVAKSHKPLADAKKGDTGEKLVKTIAYFSYSFEEFSTKKSVEKHLASSDFEGEVVITKSNEDEEWIVTPKELEGKDIDTLVKNITEAPTGVEGVSAYIGETTKELAAKIAGEEEGEETISSDDEEGEDDASEGDDDGEEEAETEAKATAPKKVIPKVAAKTATKTTPVVAVKGRAAVLAKRKEASASTEQKFDYWNVYDSLSDGFVELVEDGMADGVPPGVEELLYCWATSIRNTLANDGDTVAKSAALQKSAASFVATVMKLDELFSQLSEAESVEKIAGSQAEICQKFMDSYADFLNGETVKKRSKAKKSSAPVVSNFSPEGLAELVAKALEPVNEKIEGLASRHPTSKKASVEDTGEDAVETGRALAKKARQEDARFLREQQLNALM